jgi:uncharacterized heparinase superfamily protein
MSKSWGTITRYWHTLRHLRWRQWSNRLWRKLRPPSPQLGPAPDLRQLEQSRWVTPPELPPCQLGPTTFEHLHEQHTLSTPAAHTQTELSQLWRYHLHYFDDLVAHDAATRRHWHNAWLQSWLESCPPGTPDAWDPYPTSLRIVNWIKADLAGWRLTATTRHSLAVQTRWLRDSLEYHLLGNHLLANAKALVFAGLFFSGPEAEQWLKLGLSIYEEQFPDQVLADGGHYELSPMYHALILGDLLDVWNLAQVAANHAPRAQQQIAAWSERIQAMRRWLQVMTHPDGGFAFFNDATLEHVANTAQLEAYAQRLGFARVKIADSGLLELPQSGFVRAMSGPAVLITDIGRIGPDEIPGHAHADTLSYELSLFGQRTLINSGISCYGTSAERLRQRGTAAHNTVVVDGQNSSEVWSGFRVARRAKPLDIAVQATENQLVIQAAHDGYQRLAGRVTHHRTWTLTANKLSIDDRLTGRFQSAVIYSRLHPDWLQSAPLQWWTAKPNAFIEFIAALNSKESYIEVPTSTWHSGFGLSQNCDCIELYLKSAEQTHVWHWSEKI